MSKQEESSVSQQSREGREGNMKPSSGVLEVDLLLLFLVVNAGSDSWCTHTIIHVHVQHVFTTHFILLYTIMHSINVEHFGHCTCMSGNVCGRKCWQCLHEVHVLILWLANITGQTVADAVTGSWVNCFSPKNNYNYNFVMFMLNCNCKCGQQ